MQKSFSRQNSPSILKETAGICIEPLDGIMVIDQSKGHGGESPAGNARTALRLHPSGNAADVIIWCAYRPPMGSKGLNRDFL
jgi:hypothetical protein